MSDQVTFPVTVRTPGEPIDRSRARQLLHDAVDALAKQGGPVLSVFADEYCLHSWETLEYGGVPIAMVCTDCGARRKVVDQ